MRDEQHESKKKRKRRSFWEPDSEKIVNWLNEQTDLGTSLQLIIVDAIHRYGEGDVIKAHLNQREHAAVEQLAVLRPIRTSPTPPQSVPEPPTPRVENVEVEHIGTKPEEPVLPSFSEPEIPIDTGWGAVPETDTTNTIKPDPEEHSSQDDAMDDSPFDIGAMVRDMDGGSQKEKQETKTQEEEHDPIAIMMQDSGSTYLK